MKILLYWWKLKSISLIKRVHETPWLIHIFVFFKSLLVIMGLIGLSGFNAYHNVYQQVNIDSLTDDINTEQVSLKLLEARVSALEVSSTSGK